MSMRSNVLLALLVAAGAVYGGSQFGRVLVRSADRTASVHEVVQDRQESNETVFVSPVPVSWHATVLAVLEGGQAYALKHTDGRVFYAFFEEFPAAPLSGAYRIQGSWLGTTCAYERSVFGQCVPEVRIHSVEPLTPPEH